MLSMMRGMIDTPLTLGYFSGCSGRVCISLILEKLMKNTFEDFLGVLGKLLHSKTTSTIPSDPRLKPCPRHTPKNTGRRETLMRKHLSELFVTLTVVLSVVGCTMLTSKQETSLYERLGG
jgi:hypothetical protein